MFKTKIFLMISILLAISQSANAQSNNNSWAGSIGASLNLFANIAGFSTGLSLGTNNNFYGNNYGQMYGRNSISNNYSLFGHNGNYYRPINSGFYQKPYSNLNFQTNGVISSLNYNTANSGLVNNLYMNGYTTLPNNIYSNYTSNLCQQVSCQTTLSVNDVVFNAASQCVYAQINSNLLSSTKSVQCQSSNIQNITTDCLAKTNVQYGSVASLNSSMINSQIFNQQKSFCEWGSMSSGLSTTTVPAASYLSIPTIGLQ